MCAKHAEASRSIDAVKVSAIADIPIKIEESTSENVKKFAAGKVGVVFMSLDIGTEVLTSSAEAKMSVSDVSKRLTVSIS